MGILSSVLLAACLGTASKAQATARRNAKQAEYYKKHGYGIKNYNFHREKMNEFYESWYGSRDIFPVEEISKLEADTEKLRRFCTSWCIEKELEAGYRPFMWPD